MEVKLFELRDRGTFIPVMCIKPSARSEADQYLMARAGFGRGEAQTAYVIMLGLSGGGDRAASDPYEWGDGTRPPCHQFIIGNWDSLESGQVIDREFISGEAEKPKESERFEAW